MLAANKAGSTAVYYYTAHTTKPSKTHLYCVLSSVHYGTQRKAFGYFLRGFNAAAMVLNCQALAYLFVLPTFKGCSIMTGKADNTCSLSI